MDRRQRRGRAKRALVWTLAGLGLYAASLAILGAAEALSTAGEKTEFQRGHTAVSAFWGIVAFTALLIGLRRGLQVLRLAALGLFALALGKLFLYDLSTLSSVSRALSFLAVGAVLLLAGFFYQRLSSSEVAPELVIRRIAGWEHVAGPLAALPVRHRRLAVGARREARALDELQLVDVARAVRKDLGRADADDALRPRVLAEERVVRVDRGDAVQPQPLLPLEVDEEQADARQSRRCSRARGTCRCRRSSGTRSSARRARARSPARRPCRSTAARRPRRPWRGRTCRAPR